MAILSCCCRRTKRECAKTEANTEVTATTSIRVTPDAGIATNAGVAAHPRIASDTGIATHGFCELDTTISC